MSTEALAHPFFSGSQEVQIVLAGAAFAATGVMYAVRAWRSGWWRK